MKSKRPNPWDAGVDYRECKRRILKALADNKDAPNRVAKCLIYAIQLRNGTRISEATDALKDFYKGIKKPDVLVRKKKKEDYREILWPEFVPQPDFADPVMIREVESITKKQAQDSCRAIIGVNTHNFRYARITELSDQGVNDSVIAKITHHSDLKFILKYQQDKVARKTNREIK